MVVPVKPYRITCSYCGWSRLIIPKTDFLTPNERPCECKECGHENLHYSNPSIIESAVIELLKVAHLNRLL